MPQLQKSARNSRVDAGNEPSSELPRAFTTGDSGPAQLCDVVEQFLRASRDVPMLRQHYAECQVPASWEDWVALPLTSRSLYESVADMRDVVRTGARLFAPAAPFNLNEPAFPIPLLQSYEDKQAVEERVDHILTLVGHDSVSGLHLILATHAQRFAAADLADSLICLGYRCMVLLVPVERSAYPFEALDPTLLWMLDGDVPAACLPRATRAIITFNRPDLVHRGISTVDVLQIAPISYFAVSDKQNVYAVPAGHFLLETSAEDELVVTTLRQDMLPLVRYATGVRAKLSGARIELL